MALFPPRLRITADCIRPARTGLPSLALGLFLMAFFGLISDVVREVRLKGGAVAAETRTDLPYLSKREPVRVVLADARRDGAASPSWHSGGGALPGTSLVLPAPCAPLAGGGHWTSSCPSHVFAASHRTRAPPLAA